jgi:DNA mismatch endonuclease (patch repair protein)
MSRIRSENTRPEMALRRGLHALGFRFVLHSKRLPGCPDIVFPRYRKVILVNGCFWHGHDCHLFKLPATRRPFWSAKISGNRDRDARAIRALDAAGWHCLVVWECALKGTARRPLEDVLANCERFLRETRDTARPPTTINIRGGGDSRASRRASRSNPPEKPVSRSLSKRCSARESVTMRS